MKDNKIESAADYGSKQGHCDYHPEWGDFKITDFEHIKPNSQVDLMALITQGPVFVAVEADKTIF